jgi:2,3-bisphosphoglycerate-independent phosphoglycerate mutase
MKSLNKIADAPAGPVVVVVLDGVGVGRGDEGDAVHLARTPLLDSLRKTCPAISLQAHGTAVGLPSDKDMGNSEVGHNALGAGRVFDQGAKLVNSALESGSLFEGATWRDIVARCQAGGALHLIGLLSDGNVHSHVDQLFALIGRAQKQGVTRLFVHPLLDGRDVPETSCLQYVDALEDLLASIGQDNPACQYAVASGGGRMVVTMDRYEADWRVVERGWKAHVLGEGRRFASARDAIETYRREQSGLTDQFLPPFVVGDDQGPVAPIQDGDAVIFFNFRGDRAIEISRAFEAGDDFDKFDRCRVPAVLYAGMMQYDGDLALPKRFLVDPPLIQETLAAYLACAGLRQLAAAETQKYGHVTYFWNGNNTGLYDPGAGQFRDAPGQVRQEDNYRVVERRSDVETFLEVPSDRLPFEQRPWMKAAEVTDAVIDEMARQQYDFVRVNYANGDMVGHTGDLRAAIQAVEAVDLSLARLLQVVEEQGGVALITADHGNADQMFELNTKTGQFQVDDEGSLKRKTSHTLNPVFLVVYDPKQALGQLELVSDLSRPGLANVAATVLTVLGYEPPADYEPSLLRRR